MLEGKILERGPSLLAFSQVNIKADMKIIQLNIKKLWIY